MVGFWRRFVRREYLFLLRSRAIRNWSPTQNTNKHIRLTRPRPSQMVRSTTQSTDNMMSELISILHFSGMALVTTATNSCQLRRRSRIQDLRWIFTSLRGWSRSLGDEGPRGAWACIWEHWFVVFSSPLLLVECLLCWSLVACTPIDKFEGLGIFLDTYVFSSHKYS